MRPADLVFDAAERLAGAGLASPSADARILLAHATGFDARQLFLRDDVAGDEVAIFERLLERRLAGEPVQHITGSAPFRYEELAVGPGVFIPRPETELIVDLALAHLAARPSGSRRVVELCAGSGAIIRSIVRELGGVEAHAVELDDDAWPWLVRNLEGTGVDARHGDMADAFSDLDGTVDVVVANPPYVPEGLRHLLPDDVVQHDPPQAVFSGADGLDAMRVVRDVAARLLRPGGLVVAEHDDSHGEAVLALFGAPDFEAATDHMDLTGRPRHVTATRSVVAGWAP